MYVHIIMLEMLRAVVDLQPLPLPLLLLKLHVQKRCAGIAAVIVCHHVPDDAICCCGLLHLIPMFLFLYSNTTYLSVPLGSAVACTTSISL